MGDDMLDARSLAEVHMFLLASACRSCGRGPLETSPDLSALERGRVSVDANCRHCGALQRLDFQVPQGSNVCNRDDLYPIINASDEPSRILDVGQWLVLFRVLLESAGRETNKVESRRLGYEASQCLEEAIKFYEDNDLPPSTAVFCGSSRQRLREHPELFSKTHLIELRAKLPKVTAVQRQLSRGVSEPEARKRWWHRWKLRG